MTLILLAEDQQDLAQLTIDYLDCEDIDCDYAHNGVMALNLVSQNHYDVIVLDVMMPKLDGFAVCRELKAQGHTTPIIFLTAKDTLDDKLAGFELGAEDYLTKPFELPELVARVKVLANRKVKTPAVFQLDSLTIDTNQRRATRSGVELTLSPSLWLLLTTLAQNSPNVVDRISLENILWPDTLPTKDMLKTLVFRLRGIVDRADEPPLVQTIRGAGIALRASNDD